ncbi:DUF2490 domain-containing protein [Allomuricauda sp. d1]|uniref:DUF2490 domain-containing protein n=1 Tax=Allomuricauda sp. d1 TaxID=3136725 RepID=UPI0031D65307
MDIFKTVRFGHRSALNTARFFCILYFMASFSLSAQSEIEDTFGSWLVISGNNKIAEKWSIPTESVIRYYDGFYKTEFLFFRSGITYVPNSKYNFSLGAAYLDTQPFDHTEFETLTTQFWLYEEFCLNSKINKLKISQRLRLENRWISTYDDHIFTNRLRYRLQFKHPVTDNLYLKMFNEPFFDFDNAHINQNRFFMGVGRELLSGLHIEIGYMKNHIGKNNYDRVRMAILFKTDLTKRPKKKDYANTSILPISQ